MVILFDGLCNMCNSFVRFVIKRDKRNLFRFASLQSGYGMELTQHFGLHDTGMDTVLVYDGKKIYSRSDATIKVLVTIGGVWNVFIIFKIIPHFIRDFVYTFIANRRYPIFGKRESCMIPDDKIKDRFMDDAQFS